MSAGDAVERLNRLASARSWEGPREQADAFYAALVDVARARTTSEMRRRGGPESDIDDIASTSVMRVLASLSKWDPSGAPLSAWVTQRVKWTLLDHVRTSHRQPLPVDAVPDIADPNEYSPFLAVEDVDAVQWVFTQLADREDLTAMRLLAALIDAVDAGEPLSREVLTQRARMSHKTVWRTLPRIRALLERAPHS